MSKVYFILNDTPPPQKMVNPLPDVYCPTGGYEDKGLNKTFTSKGEKFRYLRQHGMREAKPAHPEKDLGGTGGSVWKRRGTPGNFKTSPMPAWMKAELGRMAHV